MSPGFASSVLRDQPPLASPGPKHEILNSEPKPVSLRPKSPTPKHRLCGVGRRPAAAVLGIAEPPGRNCRSFRICSSLWSVPKLHLILKIYTFQPILLNWWIFIRSSNTKEPWYGSCPTYGYLNIDPTRLLKGARNLGSRYAL